MTKTYQHESVIYGARGRKWVFEVPDVYSYSTPVMTGGRETAHKVARIINGAIKRSGTMDNLGRSNMSTIFHNAAKAARKFVPHSSS